MTPLQRGIFVALARCEEERAGPVSVAQITASVKPRHHGRDGSVREVAIHNAARALRRAGHVAGTGRGLWLVRCVSCGADLAPCAACGRGYVATCGALECRVALLDAAVPPPLAPSTDDEPS